MTTPQQQPDIDKNSSKTGESVADTPHVTAQNVPAEHHKNQEDVFSPSDMKGNDTESLSINTAQGENASSAYPVGTFKDGESGEQG